MGDPPSGYAKPPDVRLAEGKRDGELLRYRYRVGHDRVGHAFFPESLLGQSEALEEALWSAIRGMEQQAARLLQFVLNNHSSS